METGMLTRYVTLYNHRQNRIPVCMTSMFVEKKGIFCFVKIEEQNKKKERRATFDSYPT